MKKILLGLFSLVSLTFWGQAGQMCSIAMLVECGTTYVSSTSGVPNDTGNAPTCVTTMGNGGQIWYRFDATSDGEITVSTVYGATDFDTKIHVFTGSCGNLTCHAANDDFIGVQAQVTFPVTLGESYLIRVGGYDMGEGNFGFTVACDLSAFGCMDANASNYDSLAIIDDGSCCYDLSVNFSITPGVFQGEIEWSILDNDANLLESGLFSDTYSTCMQVGDCGLFLVMSDDFGDGWNGGIYHFTDGQGNELYSGTMVDGAGPDTVFIPIGNGDCPFGCTNPMADNYDPIAEVNDGSCIIPGCNWILAENYNPQATIDDGSCTFVLSGFVFIDTNENGLFGTDETGIANVPVLLLPENLMTYTNSSGYYAFSGIVGADHTISTDFSNPVWPLLTTSTSYDTNGNISDFDFGFSSNAPEISVELLEATSPFWFCGTLASQHVTLINQGNETINTTLEVTFDDVLTFIPEPYVYHTVMPAFDYSYTVNGNIVTFYLENILPSGYINISMTVQTLLPSGQEVLTTVSSNSISTSGLTDTQTIEVNETLLCSFDPNDITVNPAGFRDEHYILNDTPLDYLIRFQNTGTAPAFNIYVSNSIDENLDLNSFELIQTSHDVMTTINYNSRQIQFVFNEIMLPDSNADELGSHGFISYRIQPLSNLEVGTVIENQVSIVFDINEPVLTNTAFNTITTCDGLGDFELTFPEVCTDGYVLGSANSTMGESYIWTTNGNTISEGSSLYTAFSEPGVYEITLSVENPLCSASTAQNIIVHAPENPSFTVANNVLTAIGGTSYQWYKNGVPLSGETTETLSISESALYSVESTSEFGCVGMSPQVEVIFTGVNELNANVATVYPNPASLMLNILFGENGIHYVKIMGVDGKVVRDLGLLTGKQQQIPCDEIARGYYVLQIQNATGQTTSIPVSLQ